MRKLLAVFAHPDDEAFGPSGTIAYYAGKGVEIHLICATGGEENKNSKLEKKRKIREIRQKELARSAKILGIKKVELLGFTDGKLCNALYHKMADRIIKKIKDFRPQIVLTTERRGISGHLDHIAVSMITTYAFLKTKISKKLYYFCLPKEIIEKERREKYFIYFPEGYKQKEITTRIDHSCYWHIKKGSMIAHQSQQKDVKFLLSRYSKWPKVDHFILQYYRGIKVNLPETDLFAGIVK